MNERVTEDFVRKHFQRDHLFEVVKFEEQRSTVQRVKRCLSKASKNGTGKPGYPEFIITFPALPDHVIIVECKASTAAHKSKSKVEPVKYAVDGVLHYARFLSREYNVICIAVSGTGANPRVSSFHWKRRKRTHTPEDSKLLDIFSYISKFEGERSAETIESGEITRLAIELNEELNAYSIPEHERCTLVSALLLALQDETFRKSYVSVSATKKPEFQPRPDRLAKHIVDAINRVLNEAEMGDSRSNTMIQEYETIKNKSLTKEKKIKKKKESEHEPNFVVRDITIRLEERILPLMRMEAGRGYDVLGRFYTEFIRYAGTDKKTGLVLTPRHITDFFCDIVNIGKDDVVFDSCCGTGGFLVSAMKRMLNEAGNDEAKKKKIKQKQLVGMDKRTDMFTFACSNMMMSGDGKSNIFHGDSFEHVQKIKDFNPTVAFLNPPYDVGEDGQLKFIKNALSCLDVRGQCVAIVQMSCATSLSHAAVEIREEILEQHTLRAVFSMPSDLFHPVGVVTCVMVFDACKVAYEGFETYFGHFKDDGFVLTKNHGRIDGNGRWDKIKATWLKSFREQRSVAGLSVTRSVSGGDEWCAEAYMETDYSQLKKEDFVKTIKEHLAFQFLNS